VLQNLFSSPLNIFLSFFAAYIVYLILPPMVDWLIINANFGSDRSSCPAEAGSREGACWAYISSWWKLLMYGRYPEEELWRIRSVYAILVIGLGWLIIPNLKHKAWVALFMLIGFPAIAFVMFVGDSFGLMFVETPLWGGMFLTLVIAITGIVASLPIGVVLALGRRSTMPIVRSLCVAFIELWRGVPLITVLFMASVMFPLFMPEGVNFDKLLRALIGVMLFSAAYMAEVIRGGLQAIPRGQYEAAAALGLGYWRMMGLVILPQALKLVIPGIVNTFIGLFKDTTLVLIIGLFDFLGMAQLVSTNPEWIGFYTEGYVFVAAGFWIFCFSMSRYSAHLEDKLHTGHKR
jgi:general L-amino acid transport system permease protein